MSSRKRRKYDAGLKRNTVNLSNDPTRSVSEVAANLGIAAELLYK
jgi:transposase-like protein